MEIVRATIDAFNAGGIQAALKHVHPDVELDLSRGVGPASGVYRGTDQWRHFFSDFANHWESVRIEPHEFIGRDDHVVVPWTMRTVGRDGIEVEARVHWTWTIHSGKVMRAAYFPTREEALEAAGLSE